MGADKEANSRGLDPQTGDHGAESMNMMEVDQPHGNDMTKIESSSAAVEDQVQQSGDNSGSDSVISDINANNENSITAGGDFVESLMSNFENNQGSATTTRPSGDIVTQPVTTTAVSGPDNSFNPSNPITSTTEPHIESIPQNQQPPPQQLQDQADETMLDNLNLETFEPNNFDFEF